MSDILTEILLRNPVNKTAALVLNQSGCEDIESFETLYSERGRLRENLMNLENSCKGSNYNKFYTKEARKSIVNRLKVVNKQLKPFDNWKKKAAEFNSKNDAIVFCMDYMLEESKLNEIKKMATLLVNT